MKTPKPLIALLLINNGFFLYQLVDSFLDITAQKNPWPLGEDVGWQWIRLIIPGLMIVSSISIIGLYYMVFFIYRKLNEWRKI